MFGKYLSMGDSIFISIFSMLVVFLILLVISYAIDIIAFIILKSKKSANAGAAGVNAVSGNIISAPLQGRVQTILVKVGDNVKEGDTVAIIEAMKMENDVPSAFTGTVKSILVSAGQNVNNGEGMIVL